MKNYVVYFEIYGKKLKTTVLAENVEKAKQTVQNKIIFYKVEVKSNDRFNEISDVFDNIFDALNKTKK